MTDATRRLQPYFLGKFSCLSFSIAKSLTLYYSSPSINQPIASQPKNTIAFLPTTTKGYTKARPPLSPLSLHSFFLCAIFIRAIHSSSPGTLQVILLISCEEICWKCLLPDFNMKSIPNGPDLFATQTTQLETTTLRFRVKVKQFSTMSKTSLIPIPHVDIITSTYKNCTEPR